LAYFDAAAERLEPKEPPDAATEPVAGPVVLATASEPSALQAAVESAFEEPAPINTAGDESKADNSENSAEKPPAPASPPKKVASTKKTKPKKKPKTAVAKPAEQEKSEKDPATSALPKSYRQALQAAAERLEGETAAPPTNQDQIAQHATLRLVYLMLGQREKALTPIPGIPAAQQDFWSKELFGLAALLDAERNPDAGRRAAEANAHLRDATVRLGESAMLQVRNVAFCTEVSSYGVYKAFEVCEFQPGQEVLLYAEVENFKTAASDRGYHTALKASYQILDERCARVDDKEFAVTEEYCQNPRRDFFLRYFIWMPQKIYGGSYTLQLSIEDTLGHKIGQATVPFRVKGS
jgi:hypothetical protein